MYFLNLFGGAVSDLGKSIRFFSLSIFLVLIFLVAGYFISLTWIIQSYSFFNVLLIIIILFVLSLFYMQVLRISLEIVDDKKVSFRNFFMLPKVGSFIGNLFLLFLYMLPAIFISVSAFLKLLGSLVMFIMSFFILPFPNLYSVILPFFIFFILTTIYLPIVHFFVLISFDMKVGFKKCLNYFINITKNYSGRIFFGNILLFITLSLPLLIPILGFLFLLFIIPVMFLFHARIYRDLSYLYNKIQPENSLIYNNKPFLENQ